MKKIGIIGCFGRMGKAVISELSNTEGCQVSAGLVRAGSSYIGRDIGEVVGYGHGVKATDNIEDVFNASDVVIDFTNRDSMLAAISMAEKMQKPMVSGTTGFGNLDFNDYAKSVPFLWAGNMSIGITVLLKLVEKTASMLKEYDIEIWEVGGRKKKFAPSGTTFMIGKSASKGRGVELGMKQYIHGGDESRNDDSIGYAVSRCGGVVSDHTVIFAGGEDRLELHHKAMSTSIFAKGAIRAALWLVNQPKGIYTMWDVVKGNCSE